ncbi:histidine kinase dimerization/phosphoacceptor domain -containing protein [Azospirillum brasilense]|uniref:Signal transduction histidine kinase subgroup 2 dimerisation and phosphoacceptor domain-containing protein n=1 Tax=Azospirillum brasilense TaxID=192 RepID=A0A235HAY6_AZOBR|nr:histidine kinase dimerization/phosphoacceptor domain -containing protein [Azospirillum brasilense]OYD82882.1 hypothetical protein CHT98_18490 [Azospirillum brasilense]
MVRQHRVQRRRARCHFGRVEPAHAARGALDAAEAANRSLAAALADETLFKEVRHRVENNLQVTTGLLQMLARRFDDLAVRAHLDRSGDQHPQARLPVRHGRRVGHLPAV